MLSDTARTEPPDCVRQRKQGRRIRYMHKASRSSQARRVFHQNLLSVFRQSCRPKSTTSLSALVAKKKNDKWKGRQVNLKDWQKSQTASNRVKMSWLKFFSSLGGGRSIGLAGDSLAGRSITGRSTKSHSLVDSQKDAFSGSCIGNTPLMIHSHQVLLKTRACLMQICL